MPAEDEADWRPQQAHVGEARQRAARRLLLKKERDRDEGQRRQDAEDAPDPASGPIRRRLPKSERSSKLSSLPFTCRATLT